MKFFENHFFDHRCNIPTLIRSATTSGSRITIGSEVEFTSATTFMNLSILDHSQNLIPCRQNLLKGALGNVYGYSLKSVKVSEDTN